MTAPPRPPQPSGFRADIEGMRALAVLMVLLYHAGVPWLPGGFAGVDVFFVISGFLITGLLLAEARSTGRVDLPRFWARRARRLLPASAVVLAVTAALTVLVLPAVRWRETGWDIVTASVYLVNWRLADRFVDYLAEDSAPSPVQHFWSLAVEEQFYLVWPLLVVLALLVSRRSPRGLTLAVTVLLLAVALPSFWWSLHLTAEQPATAYFVTTTRLWQLSVGALLALGAGLLHRLPVAVGAALGWVGLGTVVLGGLVQDPGAWPGSAALVPTLGAAALIAGGTVAGAGTWGPARLLALRPLQVVGALSYSLYLWHWPLLVVAAAWAGGLSVPAGLGVVLLGAVPAYLSYRYVEEPVRRSRRLGRVVWRSLVAGAVCSALAAASGAAVVHQVDRRMEATRQAPGPAPVPTPGTASAPTSTATSAPEPEEPLPTTATEDGLVAAELVGDGIPVPDGRAGAPGPEAATPPTGVLDPDPLEATQDAPALYEQDCDGVDGAVRCDFGDPDGELVVALVGDSKIIQWADAIGDLGQERGWRVQTWYRSACPWSATLSPGDEQQAQACLEWGEEVTGRLLGPDAPDVVLVSTVATAAVDPPGADPSEAALVAGLVRRWTEVGEAGIPVVALADSPHPGELSVYECVDAEREDVARCSFPVNDGRGTRALREAVAQTPTATFVTMNDWICPDDAACPPVVGDVLVYRQGSHITNTAARRLAPVLGERLAAAFEAVGVAQR